MTLDDDQVNYLLAVAKVAKTIGLNGFVVEPGYARGVDENNTRCLIHTENVPVLPFGTIGINRIDLFIERLQLAKSFKGLSVEVTTRGTDPTARVVQKQQPGAPKSEVDVMFASNLLFKAKGVKLDFKCTHPMIVKSPRSLNDQARYRIKLVPQAIEFLEKGKSAFKADAVRFTLEDDKFSFELVDENNDKMTYEIETTIDREIDDDTPSSFNQVYPLEEVLKFFKMNPDSYIYLSDRVNSIQVVVNNFTVFILPKK